MQIHDNIHVVCGPESQNPVATDAMLWQSFLRPAHYNIMEEN